MTKRKPPNMTFPGWVEQQIRVAEAHGAFANLPGHGQPIPDLDRPSNELDWLARYRRRSSDVAGSVASPDSAAGEGRQHVDLGAVVQARVLPRLLAVHEEGGDVGHPIEPGASAQHLAQLAYR